MSLLKYYVPIECAHKLQDTDTCGCVKCPIMIGFCPIMKGGLVQVASNFALNFLVNQKHHYSDHIRPLEI